MLPSASLPSPGRPIDPANDSAPDPFRLPPHVPPPSRLVLPVSARSRLSSHSIDPGRGVKGRAAPRFIQSVDVRWVRFTRQSIAQGMVEPMGQELRFRWEAGRDRPDEPPSPYAVSMALSHALLDGGLKHHAPGSLFVTLDRTALLSGVADALCGPLFVIQLPITVVVEEATTRRIAQLHAAGYRFALVDLGGPEDPRWAWAPLARYAKLPVTKLASSAWAGWLRRAACFGMEVIADGLAIPSDYLRLRRLGVPFFQGAMIQSWQDESVRALPCCDLQVLHKLNRLVEQGASRETLAMVGATDPALVIRLLMLQRIYAGAESAAVSGTLADALGALPYPVLAGWVHILRHSAFDPQESGRAWSVSVREQMYNFRARLIGARMCRTPQELEARVFALYRRLCAPETWLAMSPEEGGGTRRAVWEGRSAAPGPLDLASPRDAPATGEAWDGSAKDPMVSNDGVAPERARPAVSDDRLTGPTS